jgi:uncharacterized protein (DUF4213/DUF364 family)
MWDLYDALIEAVPAKARASDCVCGLNWFAVRSLGVGLSMAPGDGAPSLPQAGRYAGMALKDLAALSKSWNFHEAALGLAALNAAFNGPATVAAAFGQPLDRIESANCFHYLREDFRGKKVTVVGHFRDLEPLKEICDLTILERKPQQGDLPDTACEFVLPGQDIVVITAVTLINKTLPRLLQLAQGARIVLTGPTTPLTPILFDFGIEMLAGLVVENEAHVLRTVQEGGQHQLFDSGARMVTLQRRAG